MPARKPASETASAPVAVNKGERTRQRIKEGFSDLLEERSFASITIADICRKSDITVGGFYFHFGSQDDLLDEVMREYSEGLWDDVDLALREAAPSCLAAAVREAFLAAYGRRNGLARTFQQLTRMRTDYSTRWREASGPRLEKLAEAVQKQRPDLRPEKARFLAHALLTMLISQLDIAYVYRERPAVARSPSRDDIAAGLEHLWANMMAVGKAVA